MVCGCPCAPEIRVAPLPPPPTSQNDLSPAQCRVIHHVLEAAFEPFFAFWSAGHTRRRTARGGRPVCTLPNHARAVPTRPPARACVVPGRGGPMFRWTKNVLLRSPPYLCFGLFGPQAAGGAPHEGGGPLTLCPTTRGRFQRAHPRGRAWPGGGARELRASPFSPFFAFCSADHARRTARGGTPA